MAAMDISPTLEYLTDAAHLLRTAAPESAAHLMSTRHHVMYQHQLAVSDIQRQHVCLACGHIMIPGHEDACQLKGKISRRSPRTTQSQRAKRQPRTRESSTMAKTITCDKCKRTTQIAIDPPGPAAGQKRRNERTKMTKANASAQVSTLAQEKESRTSEASKPSANASSKKRAKNRKAGLQALLAGQEQKKSSPLSLSDFMQKK